MTAVGSLAVQPFVRVTARSLAQHSCAWERIVDRAGTEASLVIGEPVDEAVILGAFGRRTPGAFASSDVVLRRGSGGLAASVGPGRVWMQLALTRSDALVPCTADKLLNRYVRPLLRALTRTTGIPASYFGRDWVSAGHRPVALVAFAHDGSSGGALVEAIIAVQASVVPDAVERQTFLGKEPATLEGLAGRAIEPSVVGAAIADAYGALVKDASIEPVVLSALDASSEPSEALSAVTGNSAAAACGSEPEWQAVREEAMGTIAAGRDATGRLRVGGSLMASRDAVARLEAAIAELAAGGQASPDAIGRAVDDAFTSRGAVLFGVRSLGSIRDVIVDALTR